MGVLTLWTGRELAAAARAAGLQLAERDGKLTVSGPRNVDPLLLKQMRIRRDEILAALEHSDGMACAGCGTTDVAFCSWAGEWWCHGCARSRGLALLQAEQPARFPTPPPPPDGCIVDPEGTAWRIRCRCGMHDPPGAKGHDAKPVDCEEVES